ncbi:hypothetical protein [Algirhabdus cladophorae]|uniref:hypothetical protein n=1 Tax=Algirhabdus cladophorae TaxID=3377108 RepID=UPI003B84AA51
MKKLVSTAAFVAILAGCTPEVQMDTKPTGFVRVSDATAFNTALADRRLEWPDNSAIWFRLNSDGTMDGELKRGAVSGTWSFENGYWCREFEAGGKASPADCQLAELMGDQVRLTRDKGTGDAGIYLIK